VLRDLRLEDVTRADRGMDVGVREPRGELEERPVAGQCIGARKVGRSASRAATVFSIASSDAVVRCLPPITVSTRLSAATFFACSMVLMTPAWAQ
jgi:hypothetical protein